jgi:hypothetical protein
VSETLKTRMLKSFAGFLLPQAASGDNMTYRQFGGTFGGTLKYRQTEIPPKGG